MLTVNYPNVMQNEEYSAAIDRMKVLLQTKERNKHKSKARLENEYVTQLTEIERAVHVANIVGDEREAERLREKYKAVKEEYQEVGLLEAAISNQKKRLDNLFNGELFHARAEATRLEKEAIDGILAALDGLQNAMDHYEELYTHLLQPTPHDVAGFSRKISHYTQNLNYDTPAAFAEDVRTYRSMLKEKGVINE